MLTSQTTTAPVKLGPVRSQRQLPRASSPSGAASCNRATERVCGHEINDLLCAAGLGPGMNSGAMPAPNQGVAKALANHLTLGGPANARTLARVTGDGVVRGRHAAPIGPHPSVRHPARRTTAFMFSALDRSLLVCHGRANGGCLLLTHGAIA